MADDAEQLVIDVHAQLALIRGGIVNGVQGPAVAVPYTFSAVEFETQNDTPLIMWKLGDIEVTEPQKTGGSLTGQIASLEQEFHIRIWHDNFQSVRDLLRDLLRAIRATVLGPNVIDKGRWRWVTEENAAYENKGQLLETIRPMVFSLPVADIQTNTVLVTAFNQNVSVQDPVTGHTTLA